MDSCCDPAPEPSDQSSTVRKWARLLANDSVRKGNQSNSGVRSPRETDYVCFKRNLGPNHLLDVPDPDPLDEILVSVPSEELLRNEPDVPLGVLGVCWGVDSIQVCYQVWPYALAKGLPKLIPYLPDIGLILLDSARAEGPEGADELTHHSLVFLREAGELTRANPYDSGTLGHPTEKQPPRAFNDHHRCPGRDLNSRRYLERVTCLTGLHYRGPTASRPGKSMD
jgi:hypothetical protein